MRVFSSCAWSRTGLRGVGLLLDAETPIPVERGGDLLDAGARQVPGVAAVVGEFLEAVLVQASAQPGEGLVDAEAAVLGEVVCESLERMGDRLGLRGIDELEDGGEVDVLPAVLDRGAAAGARELP